MLLELIGIFNDSVWPEALVRWAPRISAAHAWGDVALLHGMACACSVDVTLFYNGGRYLVGQSYLPNGLDDAECLGTVTV